MDGDTLLAVACLVLLAFVTMMCTLLAVIRKGAQPKEADNKDARHLEFSKGIMMCMLGMWVVGGLVGFWIVVFKDPGKLDAMLNYVSDPLTVGAAFYSVKSGAENWAKLGGKKIGTTDDNYTEPEEYEQ